MKNNEQRKFIIGLIFLSVGLVFLIRLFYVQVIDDHYKLDAASNVLRHIVKYPARGLIYDRNGELLVYNEAAYDLMVIPRQMSETMDTVAFCQLIGIRKDEFIAKMNKAKSFSSHKASTFEKEIPAKAYAKIQEKLYNYPAFYAQVRTLRNYPQESAAHILGYIGEVNQEIVNDNSYYEAGDYIGISGVEKSYEEHLRGKRGLEIVMVDVFNREKGKFMDGLYDSTAVAGSDIKLSIDAELQKYGEQLMQNKKGSIVAIDPSTGEILALISSPTYNPNLLVGRERGENYHQLNLDSTKPLFNRALMAKYPPGSTFKSVNALIGLQEEVLTPYTRYSCRNGYRAGGLTVGCHSHRSPVDLEYSIETSCNSYYCNVYRSIIDKYPRTDIGYKVWRDYVLRFGLGRKTGIDIPNELSGFVPEVDYYNKYYSKGGWSSLTVISLAIGQGELGFTPLQMANMVTVIANKGYYITPHLVKEIDGRAIVKIDSTVTKNETKIDAEHFKVVREAMYEVVERGTGTLAQVDSIKVCGKTGTVQNPHGEDHSTFIAFAPMDEPKIAISVYVENGVWGSRWAAPISGLMIEKYLKGYVLDKALEKRMLEGNLMTPKDED